MIVIHANIYLWLLSFGIKFLLNDKQTHDYYRDNPSARLSVLFIICIGSFLTPLSLSATLVAIPSIAHDLNADAVYVSWIPATFLLSNIATLLPAGRLADIYGRKRIYFLGTIIFLLSTLLAAFSTSIQMLLVFRSLQGIGAAFFFSTGMAIITSVFLNKGRGAALGWVVAAVYAGLTCGPFLGGLLTDMFGWRSVFLLQAPFALIGGLLILTKMKGEWRNINALKLDVVGSLLLAIWIITLFIGVTQLPEFQALLMLLMSMIFLLIFLRHNKQSPNPIIKLKVIRENFLFSNSLMASLCMYGGQYGLIFIIGLYLQYNQGLSPTETGRLIMLQAIIMAMLAPVAGRLSDSYKPWLLAALGCFSFSIGVSLLLFINISNSLWVFITAFIFMGIGFGLFSTPNNSAGMGSVSKDKLSMASALLTMARLVGQMIGTAIVTLLMSLLIGSSKISPDKFEDLFVILITTAGVSLILSLAGVYFCFLNRSAARN